LEFRTRSRVEAAPEDGYARTQLMVIAMRRAVCRHPRRFLTLLAVVIAAISAAHAAPQEHPSDDPGNYSVCSNLGVYIFVGGTGGFDALRDGDQFGELLKTGHVGAL
jgi:hypothetical protein